MKLILKILIFTVLLCLPLNGYAQGKVRPGQKTGAGSKGNGGGGKGNVNKPKLTPEQQEAVNNILANMVLVKGGDVMIGSDAGDAYPDESPVHRAAIGDFQLCKYEVTQKEWEAIMGDNPAVFRGDEGEDSRTLPVEYVSWRDCDLFIYKLNKLTGKKFRLPTEEEWEYAARGGRLGKGYKYSGSDNIEEVAWYGRNSGRRTHPVGSKMPNELGLYDMSGNVWEWTSSNCSPDYSLPKRRGTYVNRGGCWGVSSRDCRSTCRGGEADSDRLEDVGLRLAADPN